MQYSRELEEITGIKAKNISAKVSGYKAAAKVNNDSHKSTNTTRIYNKHKDASIAELEQILSNLKEKE